MGRVDEGLRMIDDALSLIQKTGEGMGLAEANRIKGELILLHDPSQKAEAEDFFQKALAIAVDQAAKSWELRATASLARLWQGQGKRQEAHALLAPVYDWFTEGFDTADLKDAKTLLDELK